RWHRLACSRRRAIGAPSGRDRCAIRTKHDVNDANARKDAARSIAMKMKLPRRSAVVAAGAHLDCPMISRRTDKVGRTRGSQASFTDSSVLQRRKWIGKLSERGRADVGKVHARICPSTHEASFGSAAVAAAELTDPSALTDAVTVTRDVLIVGSQHVAFTPA